MRNLIAGVALCACGLAQAQAPLQTQTQGHVPTPRQAQSARQPQRIVLVDRVVAVVGREVVTASELDERRLFAERQLQKQGTPLPERSVLERQILERLILDKAQLQMARENGIRVEEIQLDRALERIAQNNNMALPAFRQALEKDGVPFERFRNEVREQIMMQRLREREVDDRIEVSDSEVDTFLAESMGGGSRSEYNLAHVLVRVPEQASPEQIELARKKAEKARAESAAGGDFAKIAASYSDAPDALQGGLMGWRGEDRLPDLFAAAVKGMKPGETSAVLRSAGGFHVVKLIERRGAGDDGAQVEQTHARHILIRTGEAVSEADARRRLAEMRERIVNGGADFAELAKLYSADGSAARGGDLDWLLPGDTVPEFERVMNSLKPGEISQPFKSPFGWHLVQVLERRTAPLAQDRRRLQARQALKERKSDEAYQEWLRQLRDRTYVEIRLDDK
jgi:peptidyl-prolyl cis-trans isomerase SurA